MSYNLTTKSDKVCECFAIRAFESVFQVAAHLEARLKSTVHLRILSRKASTLFNSSRSVRSS